MSVLSKELTDRIKEAGRDAAWTERFRAAATWEEYEKLLGEKGIEATAELKEAFETGSAAQSEVLSDDELEKVSGGGLPGYDFYKALSKFCKKHIMPLLDD